MTDIETGERKTTRNPKQQPVDRAESLRTQAINSINELEICQFIGRCGLPFCWTYRQQILHLGYLLTIFSTFCAIFSLISLGISQHATQIGPWSVGQGKIQDSIDVYSSVGLSGINWESQAGTTLTNNYITWENPACVVENRKDPYCDNCNSAGNTVAGLVLLATVTRIPSLILLKARRLAHADEPLIKVLGVFSEGLASICLAGAMFVWNEYCHKQLPFQKDIDYSYGSGFILIALGFCTNVGMAITHLFMLTVDPEESPFHLGPIMTRQESLSQQRKAKNSNLHNLNENSNNNNNNRNGRNNNVEMKNGKRPSPKEGYEPTQQQEIDRSPRRNRNSSPNETEKTSRTKEKHRSTSEERRPERTDRGNRGERRAGGGGGGGDYEEKKGERTDRRSKGSNAVERKSRNAESSI